MRLELLLMYGFKLVLENVFRLKVTNTSFVNTICLLVCYVPKQRARIVLSFYIVGKDKIIDMNSKLCVAVMSIKFWAPRTVRVWCPFKISSNSSVLKHLYRLNGVSYDLWLCHEAQITTTHSGTLHATGDFTICSSQWVFLVYRWIALTLWMLKLLTNSYVNRLKWRRHTFYFVPDFLVQAWKKTANVVEKISFQIPNKKKSTCLEEMFTANWFQTGETRNS